MWPRRSVTRVEVGADLTAGLEMIGHEELELRASSKGIGPSTLVSMWIKGRLRQVG